MSTFVNKVLQFSPIFFVWRFSSPCLYAFNFKKCFTCTITCSCVTHYTSKITINLESNSSPPVQKIVTWRRVGVNNWDDLNHKKNSQEGQKRRWTLEKKKKCFSCGCYCIGSHHPGRSVSNPRLQLRRWEPISVGSQPFFNWKSSQFRVTDIFHVDWLMHGSRNMAYKITLTTQPTSAWTNKHNLKNNTGNHSCHHDHPLTMTMPLPWTSFHSILVRSPLVTVINTSANQCMDQWFNIKHNTCTSQPMCNSRNTT